jgi:hypothetical protein
LESPARKGVGRAMEKGCPTDRYCANPTPNRRSVIGRLDHRAYMLRTILAALECAGRGN